MAPILVLGIGNILLRDEGVGVRVIEAMRHLALPDGVELADGGTSGADLVDLLADRQKVIVIDAVQIDAAPGTIVRCTGSGLLDESVVPISLHQFGLVESLLSARKLGCSPKAVVVFGVKPHDLAPGLDLTPPIAALVPKLIQLVLDELNQS
jgi:hydrogenase maturation protease